VNCFPDRDGELHAEDVPLSRIAAEFGTPCFVYSRGALTAAYRAYDGAFGEHPHRLALLIDDDGAAEFRLTHPFDGRADRLFRFAKHRQKNSLYQWML